VLTPGPLRRRPGRDRQPLQEHAQQSQNVVPGRLRKRCPHFRLRDLRQRRHLGRMPAPPPPPMSPLPAARVLAAARPTRPAEAGLPDGTAWHPDAITDAFERQAFATHLPPVRLHDVRHAHIGEMIALGINERIISDRVGHSGTQMTRDYAAVAAEVSRAAAEKVVSMIPRRARR
jgi:integrase